MERDYHISSKGMKDAIINEFGASPYDATTIEKISQIKAVVENADTLSVFEESIKYEEHAPVSEGSISLTEHTVRELIKERDALKKRLNKMKESLNSYDAENLGQTEHLHEQYGGMRKYYDALVWRIGDMVGE